MKTEYIFIFHPLAELDYNDAYYWYEMQENGLGEKFLIQVRHRLEQIKEKPLVFGAKNKSGYREASVKDFPYSIVYKVNHINDTILISSIHHEKKHSDSKFRK